MLTTSFFVAASVATAAAVILLAVRGRANVHGTAWVLLVTGVAMAAFEGCLGERPHWGPLRPLENAHAVIAFVVVGSGLLVGVGHAVARWRACPAPFVPSVARSRGQAVGELLGCVWGVLAFGWLVVMVGGMAKVVGHAGSLGLLAGCVAVAGAFLGLGPRAFGTQARPVLAASIRGASPFLVLWSWAIGSAMPPIINFF